LKDGNNYTGFTGDLNKRIKEHNAGETVSTKNRIPFKLIYFEAVGTKKRAMQREKYLKTTWGKRFIKQQIGQIDPVE